MLWTIARRGIPRASMEKTIATAPQGDKGPGLAVRFDRLGLLVDMHDAFELGGRFERPVDRAQHELRASLDAAHRLADAPAVGFAQAVRLHLPQQLRPCFGDPLGEDRGHLFVLLGHGARRHRWRLRGHERIGLSDSRVVHLPE